MAKHPGIRPHELLTLGIALVPALACEPQEPNKPPVEKPPGVVFSIDADSNRDGVLTPEDEHGKGEWTREAGAVLISNVDDDDEDRKPDAEDKVLNGAADLLDLAPVRLRRENAPLGPNGASLVVEPAAAAERIRIFVGDPNDPWVLHAPGAAVARISAETWTAAELLLWVEATESRSAAWDGDVSLILRMEDAQGRMIEDAVALRCAPVLFPDDTRPTETLLVMKLDDKDDPSNNIAFYNTMRDFMPAGVELFDVDAVTYRWDIWVQDALQLGYQEMPSPAGPRRVMHSLQATRVRPLGLLLRNLRGPDVGYTRPGGRETSLNYGGNLEVAPPHQSAAGDFPFGRLIVGGGEQGTLTGTRIPGHSHMNDEQRSWLDAQGLQGPPKEVSTEWLSVGHVDEIFLFIPDGRVDAARPWKVVIASPSLARSTLQGLADKGQGAAVVFAGRSAQTTVAAVLASQALMAFNQAAQARIDAVRAELVTTLGLDSTDFVEVPVLYEQVNSIGHALAFNPGIQNLVSVGTTLFVPDPEGPKDPADGRDVWKRVTEEALRPLQLEVHFVDVFDSYHIYAGEAHCGINTQRHSFGKAWWLQ